VKPAPFGYFQATSVADALELLDEHDGMARLLAGGQSLVPMLHMRIMAPAAVVDINAVPGLDRVEVEADTTVIGALARYSQLETSSTVADRLPLLRAMVKHVGDRQVRNRGTIGGSLAQADPTGEMPLACLVLGAHVVVDSSAGSRVIEACDLFETSYTTTLRPEEMITSVRFPRAPECFAFTERCRRHNDFAVLSVAAVGTPASGGWTDVRLALGGVADRPVLVPEAAGLLCGTDLNDDVIDQAARACLGVIDPADDIRASAEYRTHLVPIEVRRTLRVLRDKGRDQEREKARNQ
jgi:carbon-monoxide dehydrogenase medium subunit